MSRIPLVSHKGGQPSDLERYIGIDLNTRTPLSQKIVEGNPGLLGDELHVKALTLGQREAVVREAAQGCGQGGQNALDLRSTLVKSAKLMRSRWLLRDRLAIDAH